ncbi:MAG: hypothetical protein K9H16_12715, partial [Bacteroidales bacterium]|nr:hypothetical protein [Bacteroidales bacterium]
MALVNLVWQNSFAQTKFEREYRIKEKSVPADALNFTDHTFSGKNVKWFAEESQDGKTIEAKIKYDKYRYSVEFETTGVLLDVEKTVNFSGLNPKIQMRIDSTLRQRFGDYKIVKTQIQWIAPKSVLHELIISGSPDEPYSEKYELVIESHFENAHQLFEVLVTESGALVKVMEIDLRSTNNMEF